MIDDEHALENKRLLALPVEPYLGLTLAQAEQQALLEGRHVVDRTGQPARRANLVFRRVNVRLDSSGRVVEADAG